MAGAGLSMAVQALRHFADNILHIDTNNLCPEHSPSAAPRVFPHRKPPLCLTTCDAEAYCSHLPLLSISSKRSSLPATSLWHTRSTSRPLEPASLLARIANSRQVPTEIIGTRHGGGGSGRRTRRQ